MLNKIIGAAIGGNIAKKAKGMNSTTGAMIGAAVPFVISRVSIPAMIVMGAGGYVAKRMYDKRKASKADTDTTKEQSDIDPAQTRPNGAAAIAAQPVPAGVS